MMRMFDIVALILGVVVVSLYHWLQKFTEVVNA